MEVERWARISHTLGSVSFLHTSFHSLRLCLAWRCQRRDHRILRAMVQNSLFKVHRHILADNSPVFYDMFTLGPTISSTESATGGGEGSSDAHPIQLPGVTVQEFESLMKVFYHSHKPDFRLEYSEWLAVLSIAHRLDFSTVHARAVKHLRFPSSKVDVVPFLVAAERYGVDYGDFVDALVMVVERKASLSESELEQMSSKLICRIVRARERYKSVVGRCGYCNRASPTPSHTPSPRPEAPSLSPSPPPPSTAMSIVLSTWGAELGPQPTFLED
ncbi:hypothetical protein OF83DRAFT_763961 [Amylostereum chailletii]|nr:hypothetical protein OF83DRAFT_763961 [Amylostereum chailletii]